MREAVESKYFFSTVRIVLLSFFLLAFVGLFFGFLYFAICYLYLPAIIFACIIGFMLFIIVPKYAHFAFYEITNKPALILSPQGLVDNLNIQEFRWSEIESITLQMRMGKTPGTFIAIKVKDPEKFFSTKANSFRNMIKRVSTNGFGSFFEISDGIIECNREELIKDLKAFHENYR